jgi:hypothetical protein
VAAHSSSKRTRGVDHAEAGRLYASISEWQADTGLDANSQFVIDSTGSRAQRVTSALEALVRAPTLRPEMFHTLLDLAQRDD